MTQKEFVDVFSTRLDVRNYGIVNQVIVCYDLPEFLGIIPSQILLQWPFFVCSFNFKATKLIFITHYRA